MSEYTVYPAPDGDGVQVAHWHTYPRDSVLAGQQQEVIDGFYASVEAALVAYPKAEVCLDSCRSTHKPSVPLCPPSGFSYYDAGEHWSESDY